MIKIIILNKLRNEIWKTFKKDSLKVYSLIESLKINPNKGKTIGQIGVISIRELKFRSFRFYYILNLNSLNLFNKEQLEELLIKFVEMSKKNNQQKTIERIKQTIEYLEEIE